MRLLMTLLFFVLATAFPSLTMAGSSEAGTSILPREQVVAFADRVQHDLAARGAHVAIVARMGRDPSVLPNGVEYTHVGFWVYSRIEQADGSSGTGYQVYNLYQQVGDDTLSSLIQDSPADFFAGAHRLNAGIVIPDARLQEKLLAVITSPTYAALHNPNYSVLANPNTTQFQNCTEHTLDVLMAGLYETDDVAQIKANIAAYFDPQDIEVGGFRRFLAPALSSALTTSDHGSTVATATFGSISRFMQTNQLASHVYRITEDGTVGY